MKNAAATAAAALNRKASLETLENRALMSVSPLGSGAGTATDTGADTGPHALDVSLQHPSVAPSSTAESQTTTEATDKQQAKAERKAEKDAARAEKKAAKLAAKEEKQAAKVSQDDTAGADDSAKAEKRAAREAAKAEKQAARDERKAERAQRKGKVVKAPSNGAPAVTNLTLVNARTNSDFVTLANGATVDLSQVGSRFLSVRADAGAGVESVSFEIDGEQVHTDNGGTFSLRGGKGSNYRGWRATNGEHTLKVTPHTRNGARGDAGESKTVTFNVTGAPTKGQKPDYQQNPSTPDNGGDDQATPPPAPPSSGAPTPLPSQDGGNGNGGGSVVVTPPRGGNVVVTPPAPSIPQGPDETPAPTNGINSSINVAIENFTGTVTAANVGYFPVKANASGASIARVEFYANDRLIGAANAAPYMIGWANVPQGSYDVVAKAIDKSGGYKISEAVKFNVVAAKEGKTITVTPGQSIQDAADRAEPGDTILVTAGTYRGSVNVSTSGTADAPITFLFEDGAVIDATGESEAFVANGGKHIVVKGLEVKGCDNELQGQNAAVRTGDYWRLEDVTVHHVLNTGIGVSGSYVTLVRVVARDNGQNGISSPRGKNVLMIDSKSIGNNTDGHSPQSEGGGGKWARVNNVFITGFETANNTGPGLWFDINNTNIVVTNSVAHHNHFKDEDKPWQGSGFKTEINQGPIRFENNQTYDNTGAGMSIQESEHVTITGNTLRDDNIELRNYLRSDGAWKLDDVTITGNTFIGGTISTSSAGTRFDTNSPSKMHLVVDGNTYDAGGSFLEWSGKSYKSLDEMTRSLGFERTGKVVDGATLKAA